MLNFNTQKRSSYRYLSLPGRAGQALLPMPKGFKTGLVAVLLVCCFSNETLKAQCSPDVTPPTIHGCPPLLPYLEFLGASGNVTLNPTSYYTNVIDNCPGTPIVNITPTNLTCANIGFNLVTLTATDASNNVASCSFFIIVGDVMPPTVVCPPDITVDCNPITDPTDPSLTGFATASDNCGIYADCNQPSVTPATAGAYPLDCYIDFPLGGPSTCTGIERVWYAWDINGNQGYCSQIITVEDETDPVLDWNGIMISGFGTPPADVTIDCDDPLPTPATPTAVDYCSGIMSVGFTDSDDQGSDPSDCSYYEYTITRTYSATDNCGNPTTYDQTIEVVDDDAPAFIGPPPATVTVPAGPDCEHTFLPGQQLTLSAMDNCAGGYDHTVGTGHPSHPSNSFLTASFEVVRNLDGATVNSGTGLDASGTYDAGIYTVYYSVSDPCDGNTEFHQITLNITDNVGPVAKCQNFILSLPAIGPAVVLPADIDNGSADACNGFDITMSVAPNTFDCSNPLPFNAMVTLTVTDANMNSNFCTATVTVVDQSPPAMLCKDATVILDGAGDGSIVPADVDNGSVDMCGIMSMSASPNTFNCDDVGDVTVTLSATDNYGNTGTCTATVTVIDNEDPVAVCANLTIELEQDGMYELTLNDYLLILDGSSDNCDAFLLDVTQSMFTCDDINKDGNAMTGPGGNEGVVVTFTIEDLSGNTDQCSATITVEDNSAPMISCSNLEAKLNANGQVIVSGSQFAVGGIYVSSGNNGSGTLGETKYCVNITKPMMLEFDWFYESNNSSPFWDPFGITVIHNGTSTFTQLTDSGSNDLVQSGDHSVTVAVGDQLCFSAQTVDNIEGNAETWIKNLVRKTPAGDYFVPDGFGAWMVMQTNSDGKAFHYDACQPVVIQISLDGTTWPATVVANNFTFDCDDVGDNQIWIRGIDENGNISDVCGPVSLEIIDNQPPQAGCDEVVVGLDGDGEATVPASDFNQGSIDACDGTNLDFFVSINGIGGPFVDELDLDCSDIGANQMVVLQVVDQSGNKAYCMTTITVDDKLAPYFIMCPDDITIECDQFTGLVPAPSVTGIAMAEDNCDGMVPVMLLPDVFTPTVNSQPNCRTITRSWSATDSKGNTSLCVQIIKVEDNKAPVLINLPPQNVTVDCDNLASLTNPVVVDDNCAADKPATMTMINSTKSNDPNNCLFYTYTFQRRFTGSDNCGNAAAQYIQNVSVIDDEAPEFTGTPTNISVPTTQNLCKATIAAGGALNLSGYIDDNCAAFANIDISFEVYNNEFLIGPPLFAGAGADAFGMYNTGIYWIEFTAEDPCGNSNSHVLVLEVMDAQLPIPECGAISRPLDNFGSVSIDPEDIDDGNSWDNCGVLTLELSQSAFDCNDVGVNTVILTATDAAGNMNSCTTTVTITLPTQPGILCPPGVTVDCEDFDPMDPSTTGGSATIVNAGPCTGMFSTNYTDVLISGIAPYCQTLQRTWTAGNASCVQTITVQDSEPLEIQDPSTLIPALPTTAECIPPVAPTLKVTDNCSDDQDVNATVAEIGRSADPTSCSHYEYTIEWAWSASDGCHTDSEFWYINVEDNEAPVLTIADPFVYPTDPDVCEAYVTLNLLDYIEDCAVADQYLFVTNTITDLATMMPVANGNGTTNINGLYDAGFYEIEVTMEDRCGNIATETFVLHVEDQQTPEAVCFTAVTIALDNTGVATLDAFTQVDDNSSDNCGVIVDYSLSQDVFNAVGVYPITMIVTDEAGNMNDCPSIITVVDDPTFKAGTVVAQPGSMALVPVTAQLFNDLTSFQFKLTISPALATILGIQDVHPTLAANGSIGIGVGTGIVGWYENPPLAGIDIPDGDLLFNLKVMVDAGATIPSSADVIIDLPAMEIFQMIGGFETQVPGNATNGKILINDPMNIFTVSGNLLTKLGASPANAPILSVNVLNSLSLSDNLNDGSDPGEYSFAVPGGSNITITPEKNINYQNGTLTTNDAFRAHHFALGNDPPDPMMTPLNALQIVAADANCDNIVTTSDATKIHQLAANANSITLPKSWRFIEKTQADALVGYPFSVVGPPFTALFDESITLNNVAANTPNQDFRGIKVGNVVGAENPNLFINATSDGDDVMALLVEDRPITAGQEVSVTFKAVNFTQFVTSQFTLKFDPQVLEFVGTEVQSLAGSTGMIFNATAKTEGYLGISWYNLTSVSLPYGEQLYTVTFTALQDSPNLSQLLSVSDDVIIVEATRSNGVIAGVDLVFEGGVTSTGEPLANGFALYQNHPNPFGFKTSIGFCLPESSHATLTISDASGRVLKVVEGHYGAGYHKVFIDRSELAADGVLLYRLETPAHTAVRKMILLD